MECGDYRHRFRRIRNDLRLLRRKSPHYPRTPLPSGRRSGANRHSGAGKRPLGDGPHGRPIGFLPVGGALRLCGGCLPPCGGDRRRAHLAIPWRRSNLRRMLLESSAIVSRHLGLLSQSQVSAWRRIRRNQRGTLGACEVRGFARLQRAAARTSWSLPATWRRSTPWRCNGTEGPRLGNRGPRDSRDPHRKVHRTPASSTRTVSPTLPSTARRDRRHGTWRTRC